MEIPQGKVCYNSEYTLNCSMEETMETCMWMITHPGGIPQTIGLGTEVILLPCSNQTAIDLLNITENWAGEFLNPWNRTQELASFACNQNEMLK